MTCLTEVTSTLLLSRPWGWGLNNKFFNKHHGGCSIPLSSCGGQSTDSFQELFFSCVFQELNSGVRLAHMVLLSQLIGPLHTEFFFFNLNWKQACFTYQSQLLFLKAFIVPQNPVVFTRSLSSLGALLMLHKHVTAVSVLMVLP